LAGAGTGGIGEAGANPSFAGAGAGESSAGTSGAGDGAAASVANGSPPKAFVPRRPPDPGVEFVWPETLPGGDDICQPGTYTGDFFCVANAAFLLQLVPPEDGAAGIPVLGPVTLTFERSMDGEFLEIKKGVLEGLALEAWGFVAELEGRLDCKTLKFEAHASSGVYGLGLPVAVPMGTFGGTLTGTLDPTTRQLEGDWALVDDFGVQGCNGPWTASHTP
jgi:hypothetical protein